MKLADTNVLLDFCRLAPERDARARAIADMVLKEGDSLVVGEVVLAEAVWVLSSGYAMSQQKAAEIVSVLLSGSEFRAWDQPLAESALAMLRRSPGMDIADCLLAARSVRDGDVVVTHDRQLHRLIETEVAGKDR